MLLAAPFGRLPYLPALVCWTVIGLAVFLWVAFRRGDQRRLLIPILLSPASRFLPDLRTEFVADRGDAVDDLRLPRQRPLLAGILIGTLTLKPQLGLLFPVMLAASGRWRVFVAAAVTGLLIAAAAAALFGPQAWSDFVAQGPSGAEFGAGRSAGDRNPILSDDLHECARRRRRLRARHGRPGLLLRLGGRGRVLRLSDSAKTPIRSFSPLCSWPARFAPCPISCPTTR